MIKTVSTLPDEELLKRNRAIYDMYQRVGVQAEVAAHFGLSRERVRQILKDEFGVETATRFEVKQRRDVEIDAAIKSGLSVAQTAEKLGLKEYIVASRVRTNPELKAIIQKRAAAVRAKKNAELSKFLPAVKRGESVMEAVNKDRAAAGRLRRLLHKRKVPLRSRSRWQNYSDRERLAKDMLSMGKSWTEITEAINEVEGQRGLEPVTESAVMAWCYARGFKRMTEAEIAERPRQILALYEDGMEPREIASAYDISLRTVCTILQKLGVQPAA